MGDPNVTISCNCRKCGGPMVQTTDLPNSVRPSYWHFTCYRCENEAATERRKQEFPELVAREQAARNTVAEWAISIGWGSGLGLEAIGSLVAVSAGNGRVTLTGFGETSADAMVDLAHKIRALPADMPDPTDLSFPVYGNDGPIR